MANKRDNRLFNPSGCLTLEAINLFHTGELGDLELQQVNQHIAGCEICADAMDGYTYLPDQRKQIHLVNSIRKKVKSRYAAGSYRSMRRRERKLNPTLAYISAAATVIIIFGIYGIINTDIFRQDILVAEQIPEKEEEREEVTSQVEVPLLETTVEAVSEKPEKSDYIEPKKGVPAREVPEEKVKITGIAEMEEEMVAELDNNLVLVKKEMEVERPVDTLVIDGVSEVGGVEAVALAERPESRKAAAIPAIAEPADREKKAKLIMEDEDTIIDDQVFTNSDELPKFIKTGYEDFEEYIQKNLVYPPEALKGKISGEVLVQFVVDRMGNVREVEVKQGINAVLDQEVVRVVNSSPKWQPGKKDGRKIAVRMEYPVLFKMED